jgi:hypothetical protein
VPVGFKSLKPLKRLFGEEAAVGKIIRDKAMNFEVMKKIEHKKEKEAADPLQEAFLDEFFKILSQALK